jgi:hypothetical protein
VEQHISIVSEEDLAAAYDRVTMLKASSDWSAEDPEYLALLDAVLAWRLRRPTTQCVIADEGGAATGAQAGDG